MPDSNNPVTYLGYLRLDELLTLQCPLGDDHSAELFFIIAHQASELWLKSIISELEALDRAIVAGHHPAGLPMLHARRALAGAEMLLSSVEALSALDAEAFLRFRSYLGQASGMQSAQFARLRALVGLGGHEGGPLEDHLCARRSADRAPLTAAVDDAWYWLIDTLLDLSSALWRWGLHHLDVVQRVIGARPGTGGTSGVRYLGERVFERPFPTLWRTRASSPEALNALPTS